MPHSYRPHNILVVSKPDNPAAMQMRQEIAQWLQGKGCRVTMAVGSKGMHALRAHTPDLVIVLGGDGSMLGVARAFAGKSIPLLGINFGKVGFLAELHTMNWQEGLTSILNGQGHILYRMALGWKIMRNGICIAQDIAINDAVISRGAIARVISLDVRGGNQHICRVRADGLIVSTPTGASGYAVSANGPLVHPEINALILTPICPFLCNFPPMVLPGSMPVHAEILSESVETFLTADGQDQVHLAAGDVIEVQGIPDHICYVRKDTGTYFSRLKGRGFIEELTHSPTHILE